MDSTEVTPDDGRSSESQVRDPTPPSGGEKKDDGNSKKAPVRKRTKTGCLTCRRRRIKCDEGKPTCNNCIKSKRQCEGYNQRVVFKDPINAFHSGGTYNQMVYQTQATDRALNDQLSSAQSKASASQGPLPPIAPKPSNAHFAPNNFPPPEFAYMNHPHHGPTTLPVNLISGPYDQSPFPPDASFMGPPHHGHLPPPQPSMASDGLGYSQFPSGLQDQQQNTDLFSHGRPEHRIHDHGIPLSVPVQDEVYFDQSDYQPNMYNDDDQYWDVTDDEQMGDSGDEDDQGSRHLSSNDQGIQVLSRLQARYDPFGTHLRTFSTIAGDHTLAGYRPSQANSPLTDNKTAAIFWHFVNVTGPSMSLYERHPVDPSPMFAGIPVPSTKHHIWTYTFPILALNHSALLHAMLALGSLQMAKLTGMPPVASLKHYSICLRRLQKNYESPTRRLQPETLAATLLLGFYEVWNSDHDKWCKHMWGARAILKEIPLSEMTSSIMRLKQEARFRGPGVYAKDGYDNPYDHRESLDTDWDQVDTVLLSQICGRRVQFAEFGRISSTSSWASPTRYTERDLQTYEHVRDLFWWYCKMDVYQSILGGTPLLMEYGLWTQCAPRATVGRIDCIFGTFDHLILLMGRLCNFASRDMDRKRKAKKADPRGPGGGADHSPPGFPGLMPASGKVTIPKGFSPPKAETPPSDPAEEMDVEARTMAALQEWESIRQALEIFKAQLGPDFDPMGADIHPASQSPFGPVLNYRTYGIAGIWLNYLMAMIVLHRSHPSMPPVAMMAAGMAARQSGPYAAQIGRIVAGLVEDAEYISVLSTLSGAIFIESSFPLFVAAVQYQNHDQRLWTIKRLHDVSRLTGWQSARQMAGGCESAWMKAASLGRGPPYSRPSEAETEVPRTSWMPPKRILDRIKELDNNDERVTLTTSERPSYAFGLLSMEEELAKLELEEKSDQKKKR